MLKNFLGPLAISVIVVCAAIHPGAASALTINASVAGSANPWDLAANPTRPYDNNRFGNGPGTAPTVVTDGLDFSAGNVLTISASGLINVGGGNPDNGPSGLSSFVFTPPAGVPSDYTSGPYYAGELLGAFANSAGTIVGSPFVVGDGGMFAAPNGATELLLGINDSTFGDNTGAFSVTVSAASVGVVPLPSSAPMFGAALLVLGAVGHRVRRKAVA